MLGKEIGMLAGVLPGRLDEPRRTGVDTPLAGQVHHVEKILYSSVLVHPG